MRLRWKAVALAAALLGASAAPAAAQTASFDVLVFSKTTGFRHTDAIDAGKTAHPGAGHRAELLVTLDRGRDAVHRRDAASVRGRRDAAHRRRGHPQRGPAHGVRALVPARQGPRRHPRRRQRRPQLGLDDRRARRLAVPQPPERRASSSRRRSTSSTRITPLRRGFPPTGCARTSGTTSPTSRRRPRPRQARREHVRRGGRHPRGRRPPDRLVLELRPRPRTSTPASATTAPPGRSRATASTSWARIEWAAGATPGDCGAPRDGIPTDASFDKVTLDDNTENPMEIAVAPGGNVYVVELAGKVKYYNATTALGPHRRHDPRAPRQRERPARHRAGPELRHQQVAVPLLQRADARGAARLALHGRRRTATSTWPPRRCC